MPAESLLRLVFLCRERRIEGRGSRGVTERSPSFSPRLSKPGVPKIPHSSFELRHSPHPPSEGLMSPKIAFDDKTSSSIKPPATQLALAPRNQLDCNQTNIPKK